MNVSLEGLDLSGVLQCTHEDLKQFDIHTLEVGPGGGLFGFDGMDDGF
jgi:hypothetical protein